MNRRPFLKNYGVLMLMLAGMVGGGIVGALWSGATALKPLGTVFINMMFCLVVPMVFTSIAGAVANMGSPRRAGKIMGVTIVTFLVTGTIACAIMMILVKIFPLSSPPGRGWRGWRWRSPPPSPICW